MKKLTILLLKAIIALSAAAQPLPPKATGEVVKHTYYELQYSEADEQAAWVYYVLTPKNVNGLGERDNKFKADPSVKTGSSELTDYKGSGYDRGHLCPAGSMKQNQQAMDETFYMSNMSPQLPAFNRDGWKRLEEKVRTWVYTEDTLHVVTGPIFKDNLGTIGANKVTVPGYYYKVIYAPRDKQMVAFIVPHRKITEPLETFMVPVDEVEKQTGIDFFYLLPDELENRLEKGMGKWEY